MTPRILIAGIGNIFLSDDAFGPQVIQLLLEQSFPGNIQITDYGIRGIDLAYTLLNPWDSILLIDAFSNNEKPGTLTLLQPDLSTISPDPTSLQGHSLNPVAVLQMVQTLGGPLPQNLFLLGCEPTPIDPDADIQATLSPPVAAAIPEAIKMILNFVARVSNPCSPNLLQETCHAHDQIQTPA